MYVLFLVSWAIIKSMHMAEAGERERSFCFLHIKICPADYQLTSFKNMYLLFPQNLDNIIGIVVFYRKQGMRNGLLIASKIIWTGKW